MAQYDIVYFAWVRERIGVPSEKIESDALHVSDLIAELSTRAPRYAAAFADPYALRVALDQDLSHFDAPLQGAREIAIFPPMTGG
jgi:molybdopterin synthase sulfur carrier subunit